jgi:NAD(P)-dependent dehydrogenase (short-subunit alcohol dehydrogenase family)
MGAVRYDFSGEKVLVTGASRGIGRAVAEGFARAGAELFMLADDRGVAETAGAVSASTGATCHALACDITDSAAVHAALDGMGRIDVLVNNAGLERITPLADPDPEVEQAFRRIVEINVIGTYLATRHAAARMPPGGRIILTASIWSRTAVPEFSGYVASKHANLGFMRSVAYELGPRGIRVNAVCPGWVRTEAAMLSLATMSRRSGKPEQILLDEIVAAQVLPGLLEPEDMVPLYLFLASEAARDITGQVYMLDRGEVMA